MTENLGSLSQTKPTPLNPVSILTNLLVQEQCPVTLFDSIIRNMELSELVQCKCVNFELIAYRLSLSEDVCSSVDEVVSLLVGGDLMQKLVCLSMGMLSLKKRQHFRNTNFIQLQQLMYKKFVTQTKLLMNYFAQLLIDLQPEHLSSINTVLVVFIEQKQLYNDSVSLDLSHIGSGVMQTCSRAFDALDYTLIDECLATLKRLSIISFNNVYQLQKGSTPVCSPYSPENKSKLQLFEFMFSSLQKCCEQQNIELLTTFNEAFCFMCQFSNHTYIKSINTNSNMNMFVFTCRSFSQTIKNNRGIYISVFIDFCLAMKKMGVENWFDQSFAQYIKKISQGCIAHQQKADLFTKTTAQRNDKTGVGYGMLTRRVID
ncbi:Hypothetical_protein [Hexamita inflata]|uniref:Hypothetical_protein n=1 Tax=Hexamita inflata TaxID=28002 RepID=A0AA86U7H4_9EUKA|nr:Hypothetical protein HINF_LOCUS31769 [Hexamita inflata]